MASLTDHILLIGFGLSMLLTLGQLTQKERKQRNYLFAGLFFSFGLIQLAIWNTGLDGRFRNSLLAEIDIPMIYYASAFRYFIYRELITKDFRFLKIHLLHLLPGTIALVLMSIFYFPLEVLEKQQITNRVFQPYHFEAIKIVFVGGFFVSISYSTVIIRGTLKLWTFGFFKREPVARVLGFLITIPIAVHLFVITGALNHNFFLIKMSVVCITLGVVIMFLIANREPQLFYSIQNIIEKQKYSKALPDEIDIEGLRTLLLKLMQVEKIFCDADINLSKLASRMQLTSHQLSQFLNQHMKMNFNKVLNQYRVKEAEKLLISNESLSATSIGYQVGYSNYTTFQLAFRKETGLSPSKYRSK